MVNYPLLLIKIVCSAILWVLLCQYLQILFGPIATSKIKSLFLRGLLGCLWCLAAASVAIAYYQAVLHLLIALWLGHFYFGKSAAKSLAVCIFVAVKMFILLLAVDGLMILAANHFQYRWWFSAAGYIIQCILMLILILPLHRLIISLSQILNILPTKWLYVFWIIFFGTGLILYLTSTLALYANDFEFGFVLNFCLSIAYLVLISCFIFILFQMIKSHFEKLQTSQVQQKITTQIQHVQASEVQDKEDLQFAHDFTNNLCALSGYICNAQNTEALNAIAVMLNHPICSVIPITKIAPIDSVFAEKKQLAAGNDIIITYAIVLLEAIDTLDAMDVALIIANGLDNALEASLAIVDKEKRKIICALSTHEQCLRIEIQNRTVKDISIPPSLRLATSKADADNHGFGLFSISRLAAKYHGTFALSCENNIFTLEVSLPLNTRQK